MLSVSACLRVFTWWLGSPSRGGWRSASLTSTGSCRPGSPGVSSTSRPPSLSPSWSTFPSGWRQNTTHIGTTVLHWKINFNQYLSVSITRHVSTDLSTELSRARRKMSNFKISLLQERNIINRHETGLKLHNILCLLVLGHHNWC